MNDSKFQKVLTSRDLIVIALGAMIGWGWVINSGDWLTSGGVIGTVLAFLIGGTMVFFVGITYAELTAAMPKCGGEHTFSRLALGDNASFICTWAIILGYVATAAFEAAAFPTVISYIAGEGFNIGLMYYVSGTPIYFSHVLVSMIMSIVITFVNIRGIKFASVFQTILTGAIIVIALILVIAAAFTGSLSNISSNLYGLRSVSFDKNALGGMLTVACMTPFLFIGFDVIPQTAEEVKSDHKKTGKTMLYSIIAAVAFYVLIALSVAYIMSPEEITASSASSLVSADAMSKAFGTGVMGKVLVIGGMCGILTSWNSFIIGGSRAVYSMGESRMLPGPFGRLHGRHKTPVAAILLCGACCLIAPFFGKPVLIWLVDTAGFGCCIAYFIVALSFMVLHIKNPAMKRPYRVKRWKTAGTLAVLLSLLMTLLYLIPIPFSNTLLSKQEWVVVISWVLLGTILYIYSKKKYGKGAS